MLNEKQLIRKCIKRDKKAQKKLHDLYSPIMLCICMRYAKDRSEAEDILQEGFLKIFLRMDQYNGSGSFEGWMRKIVVNTATTYYLQTKKHRYHQDITEIEETITDTNTNFGESKFTSEELLGVISSLPDGYRIVFNLYAFEGYKHREIGEMLKIDVNTSKSQYSRARKMIQTKLLELDR